MFRVYRYLSHGSVRIGKDINFLSCSSALRIATFSSYSKVWLLLIEKFRRTRTRAIIDTKQRKAVHNLRQSFNSVRQVKSMDLGMALQLLLSTANGLNRIISPGRGILLPKKKNFKVFSAVSALCKSISTARDYLGCYVTDFELKMESFK